MQTCCLQPWTIAISWERSDDNVKQYHFDPHWSDSWSSGLEACWGKASKAADPFQVQREYDQQMASYKNVLAVLVYELLAISDTMIIIVYFHPWTAGHRRLQELNACFCWTGWNFSCLQSALGINNKELKERPKSPNYTNRKKSQPNLICSFTWNGAPHKSNQKHSLSNHQEWWSFASNPSTLALDPLDKHLLQPRRFFQHSS